MRKARPWAAVLFVSSFLVACDGDEDPSGPEFSEESVQEVAGVAESVTAPFESATQVQANLFSAYLTLAGFGGSGLDASMPFAAVAQMRAPLGGLRPMAAPSAPNGVLIPDALEGVTFVWDVDSAGYVASELTGAPANGVRFLWYAVDPIAGEPVEPLNELGHMDLTDASTESAARLEVMVVRDEGDEVLADYFVRGALAGNLVETTVTITSEGFFSDGTQQLDFDMEMISRLSEDEEQAENTVELDGADGSIRLHTEEDFSDSLIVRTGTFTVEGGGSRAVFSFDEESTELESYVEGALTFNGEEVVVFEGDSDNPTFTRPDGSDLTANEIGALAEIWIAFGATYLFVLQALLPFLILMIFAGF